MDESNKKHTLSTLKDTLQRVQMYSKGLRLQLLAAEHLVDNLSGLDSKNSIKPSDMIDKKLSFAAKFAIDASTGPLTPEKFAEFFMVDAFRKPFGGVLPILRRFTDDVEGAREQLMEVRDSISEYHNMYMTDQKILDNNVIRRINKLDKNLEKEYTAEMCSNKRQTKMDDFYASKKRRIGEETSEDCSGNIKDNVEMVNEAGTSGTTESDSKEKSESLIKREEQSEST